jgi:hypothetical protein
MTALVTIGLLSAGTVVAFADDAAPDAATAAPAAAAPAAAPAPEPPASIPPAADPPAPEPPAADPPAAEPAADDPPAADPPADDPPAADPVGDDSAATPPVGSRTALTTSRTTSGGNLPDVTLCHATQGVNQWLLKTIDEQGAYNGHANPSSNKSDHETDIIPSFQYKDKGVTKTYPGKNLNTVFGNALGSAILANGCALPDPTPYKLLAWSLPCGVSDPWCPPGQTLVYVLDLSSPSLNALDDKLVGTCNDWQVDLEWDSATTAALIAIGVLTAPNHPKEDHAYGAVPGNPWKYVDNPPCDKPVTPAASATDQSCKYGTTLSGGVITVSLMTGVTYTIKNSSNVVIPFNGATGKTAALPPGNYTVSFTLASGYTTSVTSPIPLTIGAYTPPCGVSVTPAASATDQTCQDEALAGGVITVTLMDGVTYTIKNSSNVVIPFDGTSGKTAALPPGSYTVSFSLGSGYVTSVTNPIPLVIGAHVGPCGDVVNPAATATDQRCVDDTALAGGVITVTLMDGVTYTITDSEANVIPFDGTSGETAELPPGDYSVAFSLSTGYVSAVTSPIQLTIAKYTGPCGVEVAPAAVASNESCLREIQLVDGHITVTILDGVTYTITNASAQVIPYDPTTGETEELPTGDYSVAFSLDAGYVTSVTSPILLTILPYGDDCAPIPVEPAAQADADECLQGLLTGGTITLSLHPGVHYTIKDPDGNDVDYDMLTGEATGLTPGLYKVYFTIDPTYTTSVVSPIELLVPPYDGECGLTTDPLVVPKVSFTPPTCTSQGSYTLSNDLGNPAAVKWTVNGASTGAGTHYVPTGTTVTITAAPTTPGFGFGFGQKTLWKHTFALEGVACADNLAFTGSTPQQTIALMGALFVSGLLLLRARARLRRRTE